MCYLLFILYAKLFQFYFGFKIMEAGAISSGLSFNGYDEITKKPKWDKLITCKLYEMEMATGW